MAHYSEERKQQILSKLLPPSNLSVAEVAKTEGAGLQTLYNWRDKVKQQGRPVPGNKSTSERYWVQYNRDSATLKTLFCQMAGIAIKYLY